MGFIELTDPFDDDQPPARPIIDGPPVARPDWLVGADEGAASEVKRVGTDPVQRPAPPAPTSTLNSPAPPPTPNFPAKHGGAEASIGLAPSGSGAWIDHNAMSWSADALRPPRADSETPQVASRESSIEDWAASPGDFSEQNANAAAIAAIKASAAPPAVATVRRKPVVPPWWSGALERLRTDRTVQIVAGVIVVIAIVVLAIAAHKSEGISIASIRRDAKQFDGQTVVVSGRVGEIFPIGESFAFNLHQGRDTIVVFTRLRKPVTDQHVKVTGSISTGFLDGVPRAALFEDKAP